MIILGIQEAHDASMALMIDGEIVAAAQEERFTGLKGDYGYPERAIAACLRQTGISASDIDRVVLSSQNWNPVLTKIKRNANFTVNDWVKEQRDFWKPKFFESKQVRYYDLYKDRSDFTYDSTYPMDHLLDGYMAPEEMAQMAEIRRNTVSKKLGVAADRVSVVTHEDCHTFYSYFGSPFRGKVLALTSEGIGDYSNGTVSEFTEAGRRELARTSDNHLGHIYQYITLILGMKPAQHEYKVMGLAPYANQKELEKSYRVFERILKVDGLNIVYDQKPSDLYFHFRDALEGHRFDGIAGGLQKFLEVILDQWVRNCIAHTNIGRVALAGGVAQNIKACKSIAELGTVDDLYVCPAAGDTSLPLGACYYAMWQHLTNDGGSCERIQPLDNLYLGPEFSPDEAAGVLKEKKVFSRYKVTRNVEPEEIARRLALGQIIGRCVGRMEFGLRALGNRSILADPRRPDIVRKINDAIKFRDFWMPFTPTILAEREQDYIVNPKRLKSSFMTMAFDSTELAHKELIAALHPADLTSRPQLLEERRNQEYYAIIKAFERMTGVGGVLNTSLNLHGDPIVLGPTEAIYTFENSGLDGIIIGPYFVER
jgi:carbamoyltransferase